MSGAVLSSVNVKHEKVHLFASKEAKPNGPVCLD